MSFIRVARVLQQASYPCVPRLAASKFVQSPFLVLYTQTRHFATQHAGIYALGNGSGALYLTTRSCATNTNTTTTMNAPPHMSTGNAAEETNGNNTESMGYDPWAVLGLKPGASRQSIRHRYHELMRQVHPTLASDGVGDLPRMNQINKAYELITKSPTLDKRYRNLVSDTQYFYYRLLPDWMARNVDEMPRYWSWLRWRAPNSIQIIILLCACYAAGRFFQAVPLLTTVFFISVGIDILLHTMIAPASLAMIFLYSIMHYRSYDMGWLTSPKTFLRRELGY